MSLQIPVVSRTERVASILAATGVTVGAALFIVSAGQPQIAPTAARAAEQASGTLVFVLAPAPIFRLAPAPHTSPNFSKAASSHATTSLATEMRVARNGDGITSIVRLGTPPAAADTGRGTPAGSTPLRREPAMIGRNTTTMTVPLRAPLGAALGGSAVGLAHRDPGPLRFDSALRAVRNSLFGGLASGRIKPPAITQAERDEQMRAAALVVIAARGAGMVPHASNGAGGGGGIPIPLPFGGPSRKQRERDRAIHAETMVILARVMTRADSVVATRQRQADSLAVVERSPRLGISPQQ